MNIRTAAVQFENGIRAAFSAEKVGAHIVTILRGPHTLTGCLRLYEPTQANLTKVARLGQSIEARAGVSPIRIHSAAGIVYVEAPTPAPVVVPGETLAGDGLAVPLGLTPLRSVAGVDFERDSHLLLIGPTNGGKTTAARAVAWHIARQHTPKQARFIVSTFKPADWQALASTAHCGGMITSVEESDEMIHWLARTMYERVARQQVTPRLFVFLDDLLNLLSRAVHLASPLSDIASLGRGAGIHLIIGTQRIGKVGTGSAIVSGNMTGRVIFRTTSAQDAALFAGRGDTGAESIGTHPGDAILISTAGVQRIAVGYVSDEHLAGLPQGGGGRPWARARTGTDAGIPPAETPKPAEMPAVTGIPVGIPVMEHLPYRDPGPAELETLRRVYIQNGNKTNRTLAQAYAEGKTQKSLAWLHRALEAV